MKRKLLYTAILIMAAFSAKSQVFFSQNFNSPATLSSIIGTGANQFDGIVATGATNDDPPVPTTGVAIVSDKLVLSRFNSAAAGDVAYFVRTTELAPATQFIKVQFKLTIASTATNATVPAAFAFGSGFTNDNSQEADSKTWARLGINFHNSNATIYRLRSGSTNAANQTKSVEATLTLYLNATNEPQSYTEPDNVTPRIVPANSWHVYVGNTIQFAAPDLAAITPGVTINNFKFRASTHIVDWTIDDLTMESLTVVLPVSLTSFTGNWGNGASQLKWQTASEQNNSHFDLLRSADGKSFAKIGTKAGNGTTSQISNYTYTDRTALAGINYYKLRQVDFDGKYKDYDAVAVKNPLQAQLLAAIVTASGDLSVKLNSSLAKSANLSIINTQGKKIATHNVSLQEGENHLLLPFSQAAAGVYIVSVDGAQPQKFLKK